MLQTDLAAGGPGIGDIIVLPESGMKPDDLLDNDVTIDLLPLIKSSAPNIMKLFEKYPKASNLRLLEDGRLASIPAYILDGSQDLAALGLRIAWMEKGGVTKIPETTDELLDSLRAIVKSDGNGNGKADEVGITMRFGDAWFDFLLISFGIQPGNTNNTSSDYGKLFYADGEVFKSKLDKPGYKAAIAYMNTIYKENLIDHKCFEPGDQEARSIQISTENLMGAMIWNWLGPIEGAHDDFKEKYGDSSFTAIAWPKSPLVDKIETEKPSTIKGNVVVTKNSKNPEAAIKFLDYLYSDEGILLSQWGIENDSYIVKDGKKVFTDKIIIDPLPAEEDKAKLYTSYGLHTWMSIEDGEAIGQLQRVKEFGRGVKKLYADLAVLQPFPQLSLNTDERKLRSQLMADIGTYVDENKRKFITGVRPMSEWEDFIKGLNETLKLPEVADKILNPAYKRYLANLGKIN
ncbi:MAG: extracellular solute-binding protein [Ruminiclostridium sp.]|nr:extracellular solute-binding protein [Ruminiclostridium sp.]